MPCGPKKIGRSWQHGCADVLACARRLLPIIGAMNCTFSCRAAPYRQGLRRATRRRCANASCGTAFSYGSRNISSRPCTAPLDVTCRGAEPFGHDATGRAVVLVQHQCARCRAPGQFRHIQPVQRIVRGAVQTQAVRFEPAAFVDAGFGLPDFGGDPGAQYQFAQEAAAGRRRGPAVSAIRHPRSRRRRGRREAAPMRTPTNVTGPTPQVLRSQRTPAAMSSSQARTGRVRRPRRPSRRGHNIPAAMSDGPRQQNAPPEAPAGDRRSCFVAHRAADQHAVPCRRAGCSMPKLPEM